MSNSKSGFVKLKAVRGWLFDVYPSSSNEIVVWIITENNERVRFVDKYTHRIYVSGDLSDLEDLVEKIDDGKSAMAWRFVEKHVDFMQTQKQKVLEIALFDYGRTHLLARRLLRLGDYEKFRLYNVDVAIAQAYLYDKDIFPLAHVTVVDSGKNLYYDLLDSVEDVDYDVPPLRSMHLNVSANKEGSVQKLTDKISNITLESNDKTIKISEGNEQEKILEFVSAVQEEDPDIVFTSGGDSFWLPYLTYRAFVNGMLNRFVLSREEIPLKVDKSRGRTFFSYGRVYHKSPTRRLFGRVHIDTDNTFIYTSCGLEGLIELSRTCRVPLHRAARASIGSIMSSLQLYTVWKDDLLIPWKKTEPESFKSAWGLLVADRGGFIFEPRLGLHTDVVEVDFTSMFPMLMFTRNISAETVLCECCANSKLRVPELEYNICEKKRGIVPKTLQLLLKKRLQYKDLARGVSDGTLKKIYNKRQSALKWILVTCFGYLGYRNARFGKVDAHIAVCAFARDVLLKTAKMAEEHGFDVIHGIVDSLWLKKPNVSPKEIVEFCHEVSTSTGVPLNVEGKYKWIVFLPSKVLEGVPVLNRYYGVFENGSIKVRGVETRRRDTPMFIVDAQTDMIRQLALASNPENFMNRIPQALDVLRRYADRLNKGEVDVRSLLIAKRLSKPPSSYNHEVFQALAAKQLEHAGFEVHPGQLVQYLIVKSDSRWNNVKVVAAPLLKPGISYDTKEYLKLLISAGETLLGVFGYTKSRIETETLHHEKQTTIA